jgi:purine-binding chemotaxis protein CheW
MSSIAESGESERRRILTARTVALAEELLENPTEGEQIEIVEFLLADERYAIESAYIGEVYPLKDLTPLPCTPPFVLGVINMRGRIISIIDLRIFFEMTNKGLSDLNRVIVLHDGTMEFGILADAIIDARWISRTTLLPSLPTLTEIRAEYLLGVTPERLVLLDGGKILSDRKLVVHDEV